jgi:hypothetical protein
MLSSIGFTVGKNTDKADPTERTSDKVHYSSRDSSSRVLFIKIKDDLLYSDLPQMEVAHPPELHDNANGSIWVQWLTQDP